MNIGVVIAETKIEEAVKNLVAGSPVELRYHWDRIEKPGDYDWGTLDAEVMALPGHPLLIQMTGTPQWYRNSPYACAPPERRFTPQMHTFYTALAHRYHPWAIEFWNEPDIPANNPHPELMGGFGLENAFYYGTLLRVAYSAIKRASPATLVIAGALAAAENGFWKRAMRTARGCYDAVSIHAYPEYWEQFGLGPARAEILRGYGEKKPVWLTETSYLYDNPTPENEERQAIYLWSASGWNMIEIGFWFTLMRSGWRNSWMVGGGRRKPVWDMYRQLMV